MTALSDTGAQLCQGIFYTRFCAGITISHDAAANIISIFHKIAGGAAGSVLTLQLHFFFQDSRLLEDW